MQHKKQQQFKIVKKISIALGLGFLNFRNNPRKYLDRQKLHEMKFTYVVSSLYTACTDVSFLLATIDAYRTCAF